MMPKFRVWEPYYKKMFTNDQIIIWNGNVYVNDADKITVDNMRGWSIDDKYLMQSTGLVDINGVEIWEGDVVKTTWFKDYDDCDGYRKTGRVVYADGYFGIKYPEDREDYPPQSLSFALDVETIGNIYENPELVEVPND